jgi:hypothetical protein
MNHHVLLNDLSFLAGQDRFHVGLPFGGLVEARIMARQHSLDNPPGHADPRV